ncbi:MAG: (2Fe-2S) ferredoxin domain-containing protein [Mucilaginibacter sp.]|uniref:(2Fe-2S) ferredoxin domain-containing protein n=1 Tax=Mucilaginibacter sp. TaxID=1882438 RepID=UPI00319F6CE6
MAIKDLTQVSRHLFLCNGGSCKNLGAEESTAAIRAAINDCGLADKIHTTKTLCNGRCKDGPVVIAQPDGIWFKQVSKEKAAEFVHNFLVQNVVPDNMLLFEYGSDVIHAVEPPVPAN